MQKTVVLIVLALVGYTTLTSFDNPEDDIIGTWVLEADINSKWVFTDNGGCSWYYNNDLVDTFTYSISETSPQCGHQVKTGGVEDYYLKLIDSDSEEYCYEIFGVSETTLSINFLGLAEIKVFNKQ